MNTRRALAAIITATLAATGLATAPAANAAPALVANQGWRIKTSAGGCTIGHNDPQKRISYTAAHCGKPGDTVYLTDKDGRTIPTPAGTFTPSTNWDPDTISNDWATITWNPEVTITNNIFGTGDIINPDTLTIGDTICYHGYTTHKHTNRASCGTYAGKIEETIYFQTQTPSQKGDSGGPIFIPGKGIIGILSGDTDFTLDGDHYRLERAHTLTDGTLVDWDQVADFGYTYFNQHTTPTTTNPEITVPETTAPNQPTQHTNPQNNQAQVNQPQTDQAQTNPAPADQGKVNQAQTEQAQTEQAQTEQAQAERAQVNQINDAPARDNYTQPANNNGGTNTAAIAGGIGAIIAILAIALAAIPTLTA